VAVAWLLRSLDKMSVSERHAALRDSRGIVCFQTRERFPPAVLHWGTRGRRFESCLPDFPSATTYGKLNPKLLGAILVGTAIYTFWIPAWILTTGNAIP
jgi:hypothetical protein